MGVLAVIVDGGGGWAFMRVCVLGCVIRTGLTWPAERGGVTGMVTVTGRGNNINGAAATAGLTYRLRTRNSSILLISLSPRKDTAS